jgi:hypothetical protein
VSENENKDINIEKQVVGEKTIEAWALENKERAKALGMWILQNMNDKTGLLPGTGEFEDAAVGWARANPMTARLMFIRLMPQLMKP